MECLIDLGAVTERFSGACGCHVQPVVEERGCMTVCFIEPETSLWKKTLKILHDNFLYFRAFL